MIHDSIFEGISTVWLDLDDTLIDFRTNSHLALVKLWQDEKPLQRYFSDAQRWVERYEMHNIALWAQYSAGDVTREYLRMQRFLLPFAEADMPQEEAEPLARRYDTLYLDYLAREKELIPGAIELLKFLRDRGVKIGCLSNGFKEVQFRKIRNAGLEPWIDLVVLSDDIDVNKPDVRIFQYAMERAGDKAPYHHLMIGDNPQTDIAGAVSAGWRSVWYHREGTFVGAECPDGAIEINTLSELFE